MSNSFSTPLKLLSYKVLPRSEWTREQLLAETVHLGEEVDEANAEIQELQASFTSVCRDFGQLKRDHAELERHYDFAKSALWSIEILSYWRRLWLAIRGRSL